jgi:hypothetical protein
LSGHVQQPGVPFGHASRIAPDDERHLAQKLCKAGRWSTGSTLQFDLSALSIPEDASFLSDTMMQKFRAAGEFVLCIIIHETVLYSSLL